MNRNMYLKIKADSLSQNEQVDLEAKFKNGELLELLHTYIKYVRDIDEDLVLKILLSTSDGQLAENVVRSLSFRGYKDASFESFLTSILRLERWSHDEYMSVAALDVLRRTNIPERLRRSLIKSALDSKSSFVRNAAIIAAQVACGIPDDEIMRISPVEGLELSQQAPQKVWDWLGKT